MGQSFQQCVRQGNAQIQIDIPKEGILLEFLQKIDDWRIKVTVNYRE
jgi:hypothetical protein